MRNMGSLCRLAVLVVCWVLATSHEAQSCTIGISGGASVAPSSDSDDFIMLTISISGELPEDAAVHLTSTLDVVTVNQEGTSVITEIDADDFVHGEYQVWVKGQAVSGEIDEDWVQATLYSSQHGEIDEDSTDCTVVGVDKLQYQKSDQSWADVPNPLCVGKDAARTYKAIAAPTNASWPADQPTWSGSAGATGSGGTKQVTCSVLSTTTTDFKTIVAACGTSTKTANVLVCEMASVTVSSGAVQTNVTGAKNWATIKAESGDVIVQATLSPNVDESDVGDDLITWTNGSVVEGHNLQRKLSKSSTTDTTIVATLGGKTDNVRVLVVWATVEISTGSTDSIPASVALTFNHDDPDCGPTTWTEGGHLYGAGNMVGVVTLTPAGVGDVVTAGWDIKREKIRRDKVDGSKWINIGTPPTTRWDATWTDDDLHNTDEVLVPDDDDCIYVIDSPTCGPYGGATSTYERNAQFREWVKWNGTDCSDVDNAHWYYKGTWNAGSPETITGHDVGTGDMELPEYDE